MHFIIMGITKSNQNHNHYEDVYQHPRLGQILRIQYSETSEQEIGYTVPVESMAALEKWEKMVALFKNTICSQLLFIPVRYRFKQHGFCGKIGELQLIFKDYMFSLNDEIQNRARIQRPFREAQIWFILYNILHVSSYLQQRHEVVGDIRPSNIVINEDGQINILCQFSWPGLKQSINISRYQQNQTIFLAPEQIINKKNGFSIEIGESSTYFCQKAEVFSIGVTTLEIASLLDCSNLYQRNQFNEGILKKYLDIAKGRYSKDMGIILSDMLTIAPDKRKSASTIFNRLKPYERQIKLLKNFTFSDQLIPSCENNILKQSHINQNKQPNFETYNNPINSARTTPKIIIRKTQPYPVTNTYENQKLLSQEPQNRGQFIPKPVFRSVTLDHDSFGKNHRFFISNYFS